jgi:AhpD family alkylhydroperoxidase
MERIRIGKLEPDGYKAMIGLHQHVEDAVDRQLNDLIKLRASQVNGCAYCIDLHWREAREHGEPEHRLYQLDAWRESPFYSERERAVLALTEANLILAMVTINTWNRIGISTHMGPVED